MAQKIPFFHMFADFDPPRELRIRLQDAYLTGAAMDQQKRSIVLELTTVLPLSDFEVQVLQESIANVYGFSMVKIVLASTVMPPKPPLMTVFPVFSAM